MNDRAGELQSHVSEAFAQRTSLCIRGGGSKTFYGHACDASLLEVGGHRGVLNYEPSELVITARAGTPLAEIETLLAQHGQMLPCEPPHFSSPLPQAGEGPGERAATLGGMVAAGLSGPRRPWGGAVRDLVLGVKLINGKGDVLGFGGQVMKNVAGYDVSRLMAGSLGTLAVLLEVSLKLLPRPEQELTLAFECDADAAQERLNTWGRLALPVSATLHETDTLRLRLSGGEAALRSACETLGGEVAGFDWQDVREQRLAFFHSHPTLWRFSVPPAARLDIDAPVLSEWGGAQRWVCAPLAPEQARRAATAAAGHATCFRGAAEQAFTPLPAPLMTLTRRVKAAFDPHGIFNPGRLYPDL
jgi:glycolate oxidase FAD binding subunit